jgi:large repetitive protein
MLVLVPLTSTVFASNSSLPTISVSSANPVFGGVGTTMTITISNPHGNSYSITGLSVNMPSGWTATACGAGGYLTVCGVSGAGSGVSYNINGFFVGTTSGIPPGQADTVTVTATPATGAYPFNSVFTTGIQDASAVNYYSGPSFSVQVIDPTTVVSITVTPGGTNTATSYTAGTAVYTVTATVTAGEAEAGLKINFADTGSGAASLTYPSSFGSSSVTTAAATATTATASTTFQPSEVATLTGIPKVTIGTCTAAHCTASDASTITTIAGAPSGVTVTAGGSSTATNYITAKGTPTYANGVLSAEIATGGITAALTDAYGNTVNSGISGETCTMLSFGGTFDNAGTSTTTLNIAAGASCSAAGVIASTVNYFQGLTFGTTAYVEVSMTGTYSGSSFTATGNSQTFSTSAMDAAAVLPVCTGAIANCTAAQTVIAGSTSGVVSTITLTVTLATNQVGVPVIFYAENTTNPYTGSFVGGMGPSTHKDWANVTVASAENSGATAAVATATFTIDPNCYTPATCALPNPAVEFYSQYEQPITGTPTHLNTASGKTFVVTTGAGSPSKLTVNTYFSAAGGPPPTESNPTTSTVAGQTVYLDVTLVDFWNNSVTCTATTCGFELGISLTASPSSAGTFSAPSVYIKQGASDTLNSLGVVAFVVPASASLGTVTLSASGLYSGTSPLTIVSPNPTITVNSPTGTVGHTVYSAFSGVGFSGTSAPSTGYLAGTVTISSVTYSVDGGTAVTASGTNAWTAVPTMANGIHTVTFTVTDSNKNTATNSTTVLVDTTGPTITGPTTLSYGAGTPIVFTIVEPEGDLNMNTTTSLVATSNSSATLTSTVTGTNNPGKSVTYMVSVAGLPATTGHWSLTLNAKSLTGVAAKAVTVVVQVTVAQAQSLVLQGTLSSSVVDTFTGVSATYVNEWSTSQNVIAFAVWKNNLGQTVYVSAGSATQAAGGSQSFFLPAVGLAAGTYTVNVSVWTTGNNPVSIQTPVTVTVS